jgi:ubiquitin carboxyl-terminal hydrolase 10
MIFFSLDCIDCFKQREQIHTIREALSYISTPQSVSMAHHTRPGITIEASQQILIEALPPILVLHLKRFSYDKNVADVVKEGKQVAFGEELEVGGGQFRPSSSIGEDSPRLSLDVMVPASRKVSTRYKLFGGKLL